MKNGWSFHSYVSLPEGIIPIGKITRFLLTFEMVHAGVQHCMAFTKVNVQNAQKLQDLGEFFQRFELYVLVL